MIERTKMKKTIIITAILAIIFTLSACGKSINLSSPELIRKEKVVDDIYNDRNNYAFVLGIEDNPWIVPKTRKETLFMINSDSGNELLIYPLRNGDDNLIYKTADKEIRVENAEYYGNSLSGDGTTFTYVKKDSETGENVLYIVKNDETKEIFRDFELCSVSLSTNGSTVGISLYSNVADYYTYGFSEKYIIENGETRKLNYGNNFNSKYGIIDSIIYRESPNYYEFNVDETQLYYSIVDSEEQATYLVIGDSKPIKIADFGARYNVYNKEIWGEPIDFTTGIWDSVSYDFGATERRFEEKYTLYSLDENMILRKFVDGVTLYTVVPDKKLCYYTKNDVLYRLDLTGNSNKPKRLADNVTYFECNGDTVFCINQHNTFYGDDNREEIIFSVDQNGNKQTITNNFDEYSVCGDEIYYLDDFSVYRSSGGAGELIGEIKIGFPETNISQIYMKKTDSGYVFVKFWEKGSDSVEYNWENGYYSEVYISKNGEGFVNIDTFK
jgi:hypothetical protein